MIQTWTDLLEIITMGNTPSIQFIPTLGQAQSIGPSISAISNTNGGVIIIGLDPTNCHLLGCEPCESHIEQIIQKHCSPYVEFDYHEIMKNDRTIAIITLTKGSLSPYKFNGNTYIIDDSTPRLASIEEEHHIQASTPQVVEDVLIEQTEFSFNSRQSQVLEFLKSNVSITNKEYRTLCDISHKTAHYELSDLMKAGILACKGSGRSTRYELTRPS